MYGIRRKPFQVLPGGGRITCVEINHLAEKEWLERSHQTWFADRLQNRESANNSLNQWSYVQVIPWRSVRMFWTSNDGMQAWRNVKTGYTIPDHCRQTAGCPETWHVSDVRGKRELQITNLDEVFPYIVMDFKQVKRRSFPEFDLKVTFC